jgi:hypothetical protein
VNHPTTAASYSTDKENEQPFVNLSLASAALKISK